jgi:hypothetical protein
MALVSNNQFGQIYEFGISDADAPTIPGMKVRKLELTYQPEVNEKADDGEGHAESVTTSKPDKRMIQATATGYISDINTYRSQIASFAFNGRFFIVGQVGEPREKGKYVEGSVQATSYAGITG